MSDWMLDYAARRTAVRVAKGHASAHLKRLCASEEAEHETAYVAAKAALLEHIADERGET